MQIKLMINGETQIFTLNKGLLIEVVNAVGMDPDQKGVAIAVNDKVVPKAQWSEYEMQDEDRMEVITLFQGG